MYKAHLFSCSPNECTCHPYIYPQSLYYDQNENLTESQIIHLIPCRLLIDSASIEGSGQVSVLGGTLTDVL